MAMNELISVIAILVPHFSKSFLPRSPHLNLLQKLRKLFDERARLGFFNNFSDGSNEI